MFKGGTCSGVKRHQLSLQGDLELCSWDEVGEGNQCTLDRFGLLTEREVVDKTSTREGIPLLKHPWYLLLASICQGFLDRTYFAELWL